MHSSIPIHLNTKERAALVNPEQLDPFIKIRLLYIMQIVFH